MPCDSSFASACGWARAVFLCNSSLPVMPLKLTKANKNREILTDRRSAQKPRRSVAGEHRARRNSDGQLRQRAARAETRVCSSGLCAETRTPSSPLRRNPDAQLVAWAGDRSFCARRIPLWLGVRLSARGEPLQNRRCGFLRAICPQRRGRGSTYSEP